MSDAAIWLINANTNRTLTGRMVVAAQHVAPEGFTFTGHTASSGEPYISTPEAAARATGEVERMAAAFAREPLPHALIIACFGDPGLGTVRKTLPIPVIGMADASCHVACQLGARFAIVTGGRAWGPMLEDFVAAIGLSQRLACVRTLDLTGAQIAADPDGCADLVLAEAVAAQRDGADVVVLGGAGMVGMVERIGSRAPIPLLDSLACAVTQACAMVQLRG